MKKALALVLCIVLLATVSMASAAGKLSVEQENFHIVKSYSTYAYAYAKVANVGNKPIMVNAGILEIFDENGDNITSTDFLHEYAEYLQPDEYTYVYMYNELEEDQVASVDDYLLTITGKSETNKVCKRLPVTNCTFTPDVQVTKYSTYDYMNATVTNDTEETIYDMYVVFALLDDEDNILHMDYDYLGNSRGLDAGSSMSFRESVSSSVMENLEANGFKPTKVDVIAYVTVDAE